MSNFPQDGNKKRLKSLDEPSSRKVADQKKFEELMEKRYKTSKTYEHNRKVSYIKQSPLLIQILEKLARISIFCLKCAFCFAIGMVVIGFVYRLITGFY